MLKVPTIFLEIFLKFLKMAFHKQLSAENLHEAALFFLLCSLVKWREKENLSLFGWQSSFFFPPIFLTTILYLVFTTLILTPLQLESVLHSVLLFTSNTWPLLEWFYLQNTEMLFTSPFPINAEGVKWTKQYFGDFIVIFIPWVLFKRSAVSVKQSWWT